MDRFDLLETSAGRGPFVRHDRRVLGAVLAFLPTCAAVIFAVKLPAITVRHFSTIGGMNLGLWLETAGSCCAVILPAPMRRRLGATGLDVGSDRFEPTYPGGESPAMLKESRTARTAG